MNNNRIKNVEELFEKIDAHGGFSDRLPNSGDKYDETAEQKDLENYKKYMDDPAKSAFWRK